MQIIPVIDIKNGIVVHAKFGDRNNYAPIQSDLCKSTDIFDVVSVFWKAFHFTTVYIADLNAISSQADNARLLTEVLVAFPMITFWIDFGYPFCNNDFRHHNNFVPVLGSESFLEETIAELSKFNKKFILSLDYSGSGELGAKTLFKEPSLWPENIIIMSLPKVGSNQGPDLDRLSAYSKNHPKHNIIAAGGIRDKKDLSFLMQLGIRNALVATALHNGKITPSDVIK
jgi:phosphoribosylformimino-5-aminoimidazole carboxamide ribotide isomerase